MILTHHWQHKFLILTLALFVATLLVVAESLSISYKEALIFYEEKTCFTI